MDKTCRIAFCVRVPFAQQKQQRKLSRVRKIVPFDNYISKP